MEMSLDKRAPKILMALSLQCNSPDCRECPYWELDNCKEAVKRDAAALIKLLRTDLDLAEKERDAAVEGITCLSVCDQCENGCSGDDECIDNGYMNFSWRNPVRGGRHEK